MSNQTTASSEVQGSLSKELRKEHWIITIVMVLGLVHGLIYTFLMPPWQHYDEPSHFEYAWLIAARLSLPEYPAYDQNERRKIAESMIEHGFFRGMDFFPDLDSPDQPIWIGVNVTGALPLYHILVALPLRLILNTDVVTQLYVARLVSLVLYLSTLWLAYKVIAEFFPLGHPIRWVIPGAMALLPGFTELMTAVSNDVGATFVFSLFLFYSVRLVLRGFSIKRTVGVLVTTALCLVTKNTVLVALPLGLLAILITLVRSRGWKLAGALLLASALILSVSVFSWGDASLWYRNTLQIKPTHWRRSETPVGRYAIGLELSPGLTSTSGVSQRLLSSQVQALRGKTVTIGAWIWASAPTEVLLPFVSENPNATIEQKVAVDLQPTFHTSQAVITENADHVWVILRTITALETTEPVTVFYDGIILLEGEWLLETPPVFANSHGTEGSWGSQEFSNLIRNASAEQGWLFVRPWVEILSNRFPWAAHLSPTSLVNASLDFQNSSGIYQGTVSRLFQTFWGCFGWGHINLSHKSYQVLMWLTVLDLLIAPLGLWTMCRQKSTSWKLALTWLVLSMLTIWLSAFLRGLPSLFGQVYLPTARYTYPAIIPTMMVLLAGWCFVQLRPRWFIISTGLYLIAFLVLDFISIMTIISFYKGG